MIKFYLTLQVRLTKNNRDRVETMEPYFHGHCHIVLKVEDLEEALKRNMKKMFTSFLEFQREGSNWTLDKVLVVNVHIVKYRPMKGSSYIPLPAKLAKKKAIVNVKNTDDKCFKWSVLAINTHPERVAKYEVIRMNWISPIYDFPFEWVMSTKLKRKMESPSTCLSMNTMKSTPST